MKKKIVEFVGVGRRKTAVASVILRRGTGKSDVNGRKLEDYFFRDLQRQTVLASLTKFSSPNKYDLLIRVRGGGVEAQAEAARLGISRALVQEDETLRPSLKDVGFLTRDPRRKERKKYGRKGARKKFQFSKR